MDQTTETMIQNLEKQTGRTLAQWTVVVKTSGRSKHGEIVKMLKADHGVSHGYANLIAHKAMESDAGSADAADLVAGQYAGEKAALRPIYDRILGEVQSFGSDVEIAPKKAYVSLRRSKQFGLVQPTTKTRIDVGVVLRSEPAKARLEASGSFNAMVTHRVRVETAAEVDAELIGWLRRAYDEA
jgi:hypothetical protein